MLAPAYEPPTTSWMAFSMRSSGSAPIVGRNDVTPSEAAQHTYGPASGPSATYPPAMNVDIDESGTEDKSIYLDLIGLNIPVA